MASQIDLSALDFNAEEAQTVNEVIFEEYFVNGPLAQFHDVQTGIHRKRKIPFAGKIGALGKKSSGCTPNEANGFSMTEKEWDPCHEDFRLIHCAADLPQLQKIYERAARMNPDFYDAVGREEVQVLVARVMEAMDESFHNKIWFADKAADTVANGGVFAAGTDLDYWNTQEGLFKQYFADASVKRVSIETNANTTFEAQVLPAGESENILKKMYEAADSRLLGANGVHILVTRTIWDNWMSTIEEKEKNGGFVTRLENGMMSASYRGIPVILREDWDRFIAENQNDGAKFNLPTRAVMTTPDNCPFGTVSTDDLEQLDVFYDRTLKSNIVDGAYSWDVKHLESHMAVVAY